MKELYSPAGEMELLLLRSVLEDAGLPYFVRNDTFGSLYPGLYAEAFNRKQIYVPEVHFEEAAYLVREFLSRAGGEPPAPAAAQAPDGPLERWLHRVLSWLDGLSGRETPAEPPPLRLIRNDQPLPPARRDGSSDRRPPLRLVRRDRAGP